MNLLITIAAYALIAIAIAPLLFLGLYLLANVLGFNRAAERILDTCSSLLMLQGVTGGLLNLLGGLALAALGIWGFLRESGIQPALPALLIPFGLWRSWRGLELLIQLHQRQP